MKLITVAQQIVDYVDRNPNMSLRDVAKELGVAPSTVCRAVQTIGRTTCPSCGRTIKKARK